MSSRDEAKKLFEEGMSLISIADRLGINYNTIKQWKSRYKWMKPKKKVTKKVTVTVMKIPLEKSVQDHVEGNSELTEKQKLFCLYYIKNFNATQAYLKAYNCSYDVANAEGYKLLVKPCIKVEINRLKEIKKQSIMVDPDDIVERYLRIAFADMTDFMDFGSCQVPVIVDGMIVRDDNDDMITTTENTIRFKDSSMVDGGLICEISSNRQGTKIKLEDRQKALSWLAKFFEMDPVHKHRKEFDYKKMQLERERFEHVKKQDEKKDW